MNDATGPKRIQLRRTKGWRKPEGAVVVARPSKWGNPFVVRRKGLGWEAGGRAVLPFNGRVWERFATQAEAQAWAVDLFRQHRAPTLSNLADLRGSDLACWCPLDQPCHADALLDLANRPEARGDSA